MSPPSLAAFSTLAVQHQAKNDFLSLEVRSTQAAHEPELSTDSKSESLYEMGRLPNIYISERSRRPSTLSRKDSCGNQLGPTDNVINLDGSGGVDIARPLVVTPVPSSTAPVRQKKSALIQFLAICWSIYVVGWHDGSNGPLLPRIQEDYKVCLDVILGYSMITSVAALIHCGINDIRRQLFCM